MPLIGSPEPGVDLGRARVDDGAMRIPRASAVVVALSTFVAVATIAALASQIMPLDRAGAVLLDGPITTEGRPDDAAPVDETDDDGEGGEPNTTAPSAASAASGSTGGANGGSATVVAPAPAETVQPEPEPEPEPSGQPASPGNSDSSPGLTGTAGNGGNQAGNGKP